MENIPNIDNETMNKIKNLVDSGNLSDAISQISPEMIENFSKMMGNNNSNSNNNNINENNNMYTNNISNSNSNNNYTKESTSGNNPNFDLNNIDINTIMKMSSAFGNLNSKNDPRANLLNSLKPYLRDSKKNKLDNYVNLLNMSKIAEVFKNTNNTNTNDNNKNDNLKENNNA